MIYTSLFGIFCLLFTGYLAKKIKILKQKQSRTFLDFAIIFALPCLILEHVYHLNFDFSLIIVIFLGLFSALFSAFCCTLLAMYFNFSKNTLISIFLLASFGNTLFVRIPIIIRIYPQANFLEEIILYDALATALFMTLLAPFVISLTSNQKTNFFTNIKKIFTFSPFIALFLELVYKFFTIPKFIIFKIIVYIWSKSMPVALFTIESNLKFLSIIASYKSIIIVFFSKMILTPLIFLKFFNFHLNPSLNIAVLESAKPTMTLIAAMIMKAKLDANLAVSSVAFGIMFAFVSLSIWIHVLV